MVSLRSLQSMKKFFFKFDNADEFHFELMNIVMLIRERYEGGDYNCYCDRYQNCCCYPLVKRSFRQRRPRFCTMCKIQSFCYKKMPSMECPFESF